MSIASTITFSATGGATAISGVSASATGTLGTQIDVEVPASTTDQAFALALDVSELESVFLYTDGALTVEANDGTTPDYTLTMAANKPLAWASGMPWAVTAVLTDDTTVLYLTNGTGSAVTLRGFINQSV